MKTRSDCAVEKFLEGYNSTQAVLYPFCDDLHLNKDTALKLATGFGAGMGRRQEICGAISGGIIAIGLKYGYGEGQDQTYTEETYRKVQELISRFELKHGSFQCCTLLDGCYLNTPEGKRYVRENDLPNRICKGYVKTVVEIVEDIL